MLLINSEDLATAGQCSPLETRARSPAVASTLGKPCALSLPSPPSSLLPAPIRLPRPHYLPGPRRPLDLQCFTQLRKLVLCDVFTTHVEESHPQLKFLAGGLDQVTDGGSR